MYERKIEPYLISLGDRALHFAPRLAAAIVILLAGLWLVSRLARLASNIMEREKLDLSLQSFLSSLISIGLKILLVLIVAEVMGIQTTSLIAVFGAASLAVGLALQGSLSNFAGGVLILIFKPYVVGDTIEAQGQTGEVKEIQIFNTILLTATNKTVILPNGAVSNSTIVNQSRHGNLRSEIELTIDPANDINKVRKLIIETVSQNPKVLPSPAPTVNVRNLSKGLTLAIHYYTAPTDMDTTSCSVHEQLNEVLAKNDIKAPVPTSISITRAG